MKEGVACYQDYLRGLLDLTDNLVGGKTCRRRRWCASTATTPTWWSRPTRAPRPSPTTPTRSARSTATGSAMPSPPAAAGLRPQGHGHHRARRLGKRQAPLPRDRRIDTQTTDFTVAGIGDMSGDVFGNGMLLSRHIRLVAAFDHRHIFIDPTPTRRAPSPSASACSQLPRSSWADYDAKLISAGGGVWARSAKSVPLSPQARAVLGIDGRALTPTELVTAILKAPVDLLYNGGIGTYVKAGRDACRGRRPRQRRGAHRRPRAALQGGGRGRQPRLHPARPHRGGAGRRAPQHRRDRQLRRRRHLGPRGQHQDPARARASDGELTEKQRNALLPEMTDEVAALVLRDNYFQTQALSIGAAARPRQLDEQARFIRFLEKKGELNRAIEFLPSDEEIAERKAKGLGLTTPEQAVLLAYSKMWLNDELIASDLPEDPVGRHRAGALLPEPAARRSSPPTSRAIRCGARSSPRTCSTAWSTAWAPPSCTGWARSPAPRRRRWCAPTSAREVFGLVPLWQQIEALDNKVPDEVQAEMLIALRALMTRATTWFLRSRRLFEPTQQQVARFAPAVQALRAAHGHGAGLGARCAGSRPACRRRWRAGRRRRGAVQRAGHRRDRRGEQARRWTLTAQVHAGVGERLGLERMRQQIEALPADSYWHSLAKLALTDDVTDLQRSIAGGAGPRRRRPHEVLDRWEQGNRQALERAQRLLAELRRHAGRRSGDAVGGAARRTQTLSHRLPGAGVRLLHQQAGDAGARRLAGVLKRQILRADERIADDGLPRLCLTRSSAPTRNRFPPATLSDTWLRVHPAEPHRSQLQTVVPTRSRTRRCSGSVAVLSL